jgi:hypothetical protein
MSVLEFFHKIGDTYTVMPISLQLTKYRQFLDYRYTDYDSVFEITRWLYNQFSSTVQHLCQNDLFRLKL